MAALTNLAKDDLLDLLFTNVAFPNIGDTAGLPPSVGAGDWNRLAADREERDRVLLGRAARATAVELVGSLAAILEFLGGKGTKAVVRAGRIDLYVGSRAGIDIDDVCDRFDVGTDRERPVGRWVPQGVLEAVSD